MIDHSHNLMVNTPKILIIIVLYKQHVGTEDVFLGLSDKDPSSIHCDSILVKVWLPGAKLA